MVDDPQDVQFGRELGNFAVIVDHSVGKERAATRLLGLTGGGKAGCGKYCEGNAWGGLAAGEVEGEFSFHGYLPVGVGQSTYISPPRLFRQQCLYLR